MDKLVQSILGKNKGVQVSVHCEIPRYLSITAPSTYEARKQVRVSLIRSIAEKLMEAKGTIVDTTDTQGDYTKRYSVTLYAFTTEEIEAAMLEAFQAGINAKNIV